MFHNSSAKLDCPVRQVESLSIWTIRHLCSVLRKTFSFLLISASTKPLCGWPVRLIIRLLVGFASEKLNQSTNTETAMLSTPTWWEGESWSCAWSWWYSAREAAAASSEDPEAPTARSDYGCLSFFLDTNTFLEWQGPGIGRGEQRWGRNETCEPAGGQRDESSSKLKQWSGWCSDLPGTPAKHKDIDIVVNLEVPVLRSVFISEC